MNTIPTKLYRQHKSQPRIRLVGGRSAWGMGQGSYGIGVRENRTRRAVTRALSDPDWAKMSDRVVADMCAVGHVLVNSVRNELFEKNSSNGQPESTTGKDGKTRKRKPPKAKPSAHLEGDACLIAGVDPTIETITERMYGPIESFIASLNEHRRHLRKAERNAIIKRMHKEDMSARAIAKVVGVSQPTVSKVIKENSNTDKKLSDTQNKKSNPKSAPVGKGKARRLTDDERREIRELWKHYVSPTTGEEIRHESFEAFVVAKFPQGLSTTMKMITNICTDEPKALDAIDRACQRNNGGDRKSDKISVDNIHTDRPSGTSKTAALRKLRKDRPDLHARVLAKEISPHAAMIEAGFRRRRLRESRANATWCC